MCFRTSSEEGMQFVLVAEGENGYQMRFRELAARYPGRVAVKIGYREDLGHRLLSGADFVAHPSRFEPCGLVPIYANALWDHPACAQERRMATGQPMPRPKPFAREPRPVSRSKIFNADLALVCAARCRFIGSRSCGARSRPPPCDRISPGSAQRSLRESLSLADGDSRTSAPRNLVAQAAAFEKLTA